MLSVLVVGVGGVVRVIDGGWGGIVTGVGIGGSSADGMASSQREQ